MVNRTRELQLQLMFPLHDGASSGATARVQGIGLTGSKRVGNMKNQDQAAAQSEAERNTIDQVRELLFGETRRTTDHRLEDLNSKVDALAAEFRARFDKVEASIAALTRDTEVRRLNGIESIGSALSDLGAHIKKLGAPRSAG